MKAFPSSTHSARGGGESGGDGQVESVFLMDLNVSLLIRNQGESHFKRPMSNSSVS